MTTQHPKALRLAAELDDGYPLTGDAISAAAELRRQHARITELESQLAQRFDEADMATAAAQGFRDGVASVSAGSEPVAWQYRSVRDKGLWFDCTEERAQQRAAHPEKWDVRYLYTHPSPQDGMAGWKPIETASKYTEHGIRQHLLLGYAPDEIHEDGFVSQGYWMEPEEDAPDNMGHDGGWVDVHFDFFSCGRSFGAEAYRSTGTQPTHWQPLPAAPGPTDGESNV